MKIVILSGSPHRDGTTAKLLESFTAGARSAGHEIVRFDTAFMDIHPCIGCHACMAAEGAACVFPDDMPKIGKELAAADCIAFVTPIYYYGPCTQLKAVIDRFGAWDTAIRGKRKAVFLTAMADNRPQTIESANDWFDLTAAWMEWKNAGVVNALGCETADDLKDTDYEAQAYRLGSGL